MDVASLKERLKAKIESDNVEKSSTLSTGSILLNHAISGRDEGLIPGHYYMLVGDSQAGKTWLAHQILAEASINPIYDSYQLILDNPERGALMDVRKFFGQRLADRLKPPSKQGSSRTLEEFYDNVGDVSVKGPFIYVLDSEDALPSESQIAKVDENKTARRKGKETKGSYGDGKAKVNSAGLRIAHNCLEETKSILIVIKQTRDNIGFDAMFNPKTRSGGRALTFYAAVELWFSIRGKLERTVLGKKRQIGSILRVAVKKNRVAGRQRSVDLHFYPDVGFDDVGSCIAWLIEEKHWQKKGEGIVAPEFDFEGTTEELVKLIESKGKGRLLRKVMGKAWGKIEEACRVERKSRYSISGDSK